MLLRLGENARRARSAVVVAEGTSGHAVFGPYDRLAPGEYRISFAFRELRPKNDAKLSIEVVTGPLYLLQEEIETGTPDQVVERTFRVPEAAGRAPHLIEYRVWTNGKLSFRIASIRLDPF